MQNESDRARASAPTDWRLWMGITLTCVWIALGVVYISSVVGWHKFIDQGADRIGGFLEGGFAPLAFLWLVIGFFLQQSELSANTRAIRMQYEQMRRTAEQAEIQARAIAANEMHARQDTFIEISAMVQKQLSGVAGLLYVNVLAGRANRETSPSIDTAEMWARASADPEIFSRALLGMHFRSVRDGARPHDIFLGNPVRELHTSRYLEIFGQLIDEADHCDPRGILAAAILGSANGLLYAVMRELRDGIPAPEYNPVSG